MNLSVARDSLAIEQSIEEEIEENESSNNVNPPNSEFMYQTKLTDKQANEIKLDQVEDDDLEDSSNEISSAFELVLKNVANLKQK
jgi:hypothetical protein